MAWKNGHSFAYGPQKSRIGSGCSIQYSSQHSPCFHPSCPSGSPTSCNQQRRLTMTCVLPEKPFSSFPGDSCVCTATVKSNDIFNANWMPVSMRRRSWCDLYDFNSKENNDRNLSLIQACDFVVVNKQGELKVSSLSPYDSALLQVWESSVHLRHSECTKPADKSANQFQLNLCWRWTFKGISRIMNYGENPDLSWSLWPITNLNLTCVFCRSS